MPAVKSTVRAGQQGRGTWCHLVLIVAPAWTGLLGVGPAGRPKLTVAVLGDSQAVAGVASKLGARPVVLASMTAILGAYAAVMTLTEDGPASGQW